MLIKIKERSLLKNRKEQAIPDCADCPGPHCRTKTMRLKKTMSAALAAAMLASAIALPAFADGTSKEMKYYYDNGYKTQNNGGEQQDANQNDLTTHGQTRVKYEVHSSYEWSIPNEIDFGSDYGIDKSIYVDTKGGTNDTDIGLYYVKNDDSRVKVTKNVIPYDKKLVITAKGSGDEGAFTIKSVGKDVLKGELSYSVKVSKDGTYTTLGDELNGGSYEVLAVPSGTNEGEALLQFVLGTHLGGDTTAEYADKYEGTVTFTATVENQ